MTGPFPCKAISNVSWRSAEGDNEPYIIFSGGMARGSYGDKFTVSVIQGEKHVTFDFTSRVIDFVVLCSADEQNQDSGKKLDVYTGPTAEIFPQMLKNIKNHHAMFYLFF